MIENVENKDILSFKTQISVLDEKKVIGSFNKNSAIIELLNPENKYSNLKGTEISTIMGTYYVNDITPVQEEIKVKLDCYDLSYKFDDDYDASKYTFPMTVKEWLVAICNNVGVSYSGYHFPNCEKILETQPYVPEKSTNRYVVKMIVQSAGSWAVIDSDALVIGWFDDADNTKVEVNDWFELSTEDTESDPVNLVVIGRGDVEDNLAYPSEQPLNPKEIRIDSNEILELDRNSMIVPIYNQVQGFKYTVYSVKTDGRLTAKVGNKIKYLDNDLKSHESYIMTHTLTFLGGDYTVSSNWQSTFSAEELDETNTNYKFAETIEEKANRTERLANKLDGIISDIVEEVDEHEEKISTVEQSVSKIQQEVNRKVDLTRETSGVKSITLENCIEGNLLSLSLKGDMVPIFPRPDLYPSEDFYTKPSVFYLINTYTINNEEKQDKYILPFDYISNQSGEYDEFTIDNEGNCKLLRKIGLDEYGNRYVLSNPYYQDCGKLKILLHNGDNIFTIDYYSPTIYAKYAIQSDLTDVFATKVEMNSSINMTENNIMMEVNKKVDDADFGTKIIQNYQSVQIAWNQISQYFKFEAINNNASLNIYDNNNKLLMTLDKDGQWYYSNDGQIGKIGTSYKTASSEKGLSFFLKDADYMSWSDYDAEADAYYAAFQYKKDRGLEVWDDIYNQAKSAKYTWAWDINYFSLDSDKVIGSGRAFMIYSDYGTYYLSFNTSDGRLKKNIKEAEINALDVLNQIRFRQFDWKSNNKHQKLGYIAQELEAIDEELVTKCPQKDDDDNIVDYLYQINNDSMIVYLTKAVTELSKKVEDQQVQIDFLMSELKKNYIPKKRTRKQEVIKQYDESLKQIKKKSKRNKKLKFVNKNGSWICEE